MFSIKLTFRIFLLLAVLFYTEAAAQSGAIKQLMQTAESLVQQKQCGKALPLYLKVFNQGTATRSLINRINHCYQQNGNASEWIAFLKKVIRRFPKNYSYQIDLGKAYFLNNETTKALQTWQQVYIVKPPQLMRFTLVARAMTSFRMFDDAAETYRAALKAFPGQYNLYMQLAQIYRYQLDYSNTVKAYLAYFAHKPKQASYISGMLLSMARDDEAIERIIAQLKVEPAANHPAIQEMIANLYMRKKDFSRAFKIYTAIEKSSPQKAASYMQRFAFEADRAKKYEWSIKAYNFMLKDLSPPRDAVVKYNLATMYFKRAKISSENSGLKNTDISQALNILDGLIQSRSSQQYRAAELNGDIYKDFFNDIDTANKFYTSIPLSSVGLNNADRIRMKIAECFFIKNELDKARRVYQSVQGQAIRHQSAYQLADILFYTGQFKKADEAYDQLLAQITMQDTLANNILERKFEITSYADDSLALSKYASALRLDKQRKRSEAAKKFLELFNQNSSLASNAGLKAAQIYLALGQASQASRILTGLTASGQQDSDDAIWLLARSYQQQNLPQKALETYELLLQKFPSGFHSERAREAARTINDLLKEKPNG